MRPFAILIAASCILPSQAQEMLPNGGMEQFSACPDAIGQVARAIGWSQPTQGSTDYFNACQGAPTVSVPVNALGHQPAHGGNGYMGFIPFSGPENVGIQDTHEYASHPLAAPLVPGETYTVEFFVNLANISKYAVNDIGALLSVQEPHRDDLLTIMATPQVTNSSLAMLADTSGWTRIQGCVKADSAYAYITIGNFHTGVATVYEEVYPTSSIWFTYYFVDDVSVKHVAHPDLGLGPDLTICEATVITVADPVPGADYLWSTGATGPSITVDTAGIYAVQLADDECPLADTLVVRSGTPVTFGLPADTMVDLCASEHILLDARPQPPNADLTWSTGETTASIVVAAAATYMVHANAADHCGASASITVIDTCGAPVYAPNAFTPNGDGINDLWRPLWSANVDATLEWTVFDRWGHSLFSSSQPDDAWDGTAAGSPVPSGSYVWRGHAHDVTTTLIRELKGQVVLIR